MNSTFNSRHPDRVGASKTPIELLNEVQTARRLQLSPKTLRNWRVVGTGPKFLKLGRAVRYCDADLLAWIAKGSRQSTSDKGEGNHD